MRRIQTRTQRTARRSSAAFVGALVFVSGCSFDPVREVSGPQADSNDDPAAQAEPADLAFVEDAPAAVAAPAVDTTDPALKMAAGPWIVATDSAVVGVNSAPGSLYTRLGLVSPGETVLATGRRVDDDGAVWMEIGWNETTAWVIQAAFAPSS